MEERRKKKKRIGRCAEFLSEGAGGKNQKLLRKIARNSFHKEQENLRGRLTWF